MDRQVLLVEDDAFLRRILRANLTKRGLLVREAESRESAVGALADTRPDVLILDLNLPDGNGGDVLRELRRRGIEVYTVAMSAGPLWPGFLTEFQPLSFLAKPFRIEAFLALVQIAARATTPDGLTLDTASERGHPETTVLGKWIRELRTTCHMLARASPQGMRSVSLTLPLPSHEGVAPSALRLAEAIAEEYNLTAQLEIYQRLLRAHFTRKHDGGINREGKQDE